MTRVFKFLCIPFSLFFLYSFVNAETKVLNLVNQNGEIVERRSFSLMKDKEVVNVAERMKYQWFCWSKKVFNNLTCKLEEVAKVSNTNSVPNANNIPNTKPAEVLPVQNNKNNSVPQQRAQVINVSPVSENQQQQIIYQVIERAVPGPQGPAGRDGANYYNPTQNTQFLSQYSSSPTYSAQYNGFGISNNNAVNPTGDASLNTISGSGLTLCNSTTSKILYNATTKQFECGTDLNTGGSGGFTGGDLSAQKISATTSLYTPVFYASTTNASTSNSINVNTNNLLSTNSTLTNATISSLFVSNASLTFATSTYLFANTILSSYFSSVNSTNTNSTTTNLFSNNASLTNATTTNFFSSILNVLSATISNLLFTNATGTNATTTNLFSTNINVANLLGLNIINTNLTSTGTFALATGTVSSSTILYANARNLFANNTVGDLATYTNGTSTNWYSGNLWVNNASTTNASTSNLIATNATFSYATVTNGFFTNLSVSGPVSAALNNGFVFRGGNNNFSEATNTLFIANTGNIGIGTTNPGSKLSIVGLDNSVLGTDEILCITTAGDVKKDGTGSCYGLYSDINLKHNVATVTSALDKVKNLNTVNFNWIDEKKGTSTQFGYIAQDVQKVVPEVVKQDENGFLKVNYIALSAIYANAIKELDKLVFEKLADMVNRLTKNEEEILNLKTRVNNLENILNTQNNTTIPPATNNSQTEIPPQDTVTEGESIQE